MNRHPGVELNAPHPGVVIRSASSHLPLGIQGEGHDLTSTDVDASTGHTVLGEQLSEFLLETVYQLGVRHRGRVPARWLRHQDQPQREPVGLEDVGLESFEELVVELHDTGHALVDSAGIGLGDAPLSDIEQLCAEEHDLQPELRELCVNRGDARVELHGTTAIEIRLELGSSCLKLPDFP